MDTDIKDGNSLLAELDRNLQSPNIGEQSEAIARFTSLFQRFPLPILINSALLKLAEAFRCGTNFIRVQICEVLKRNQKQLHHIYNIDEFYRNIFTVTSSNDPIARSITLLTLGNIAPIVSGYRSIHHCITSSLETTVDSELNATVSCAACYVKHSSEFACNIYPKIVSIVDSNKFPIDVKIRALSVLDHGFYNANGAMTVRLFLINIIKESKLKKLICTCLTLSTKIAYTSLSHIIPQIELLLDTFMSESCLITKLYALKNLRFLAEKSPHMWESSHIEPLVSYLDKSLNDCSTNEDDKCLTALLSIFCKLLKCECNFISQQEKRRIFQLCYKIALDNQFVPLWSMAFELLTILSQEQSELSSSADLMTYTTSDLKIETFTAIKTFLVNSSSNPKSSKSKFPHDIKSIHQKYSKAIYHHIVRFCRLNPEYCPELLKIVYKKISSRDTNLYSFSPYVTELMCAILEKSSEPSITPDNCWNLIKTKSSDMSEITLLNCCVLYFQVLRFRTTRIAVENLVEKVIHGHDSWFGYKVMRQAMRYGHYSIAKLICDELHENVTSDTIDFYFKSMNRICSAECILSSDQDFDKNLKIAITIYEEAVSPLRASIGKSRTTNFQLQFLWLRIRILQVHSTLRLSCRTYEVTPITFTTLLNGVGAIRSGCDSSFAKMGIIQQMLKVAKDFRCLADCYENLSIASKNCDGSTMIYLNLLKYSCVIMADVIDAIFQYGKNLPVIGKLSHVASSLDLALEHRELEETCNKLIDMIKIEILKPGIFPSTKSIEPLVLLLKTFSDEILKCQFVYPRHFFQQLR